MWDFLNEILNKPFYSFTLIERFLLSVFSVSVFIGSIIFFAFIKTGYQTIIEKFKKHVNDRTNGNI